MNMEQVYRAFGWLLGVDQVTSIEQIRVALAAPWAARGSGPFWLFLVLAAVAVMVLWFYLRRQQRGSLATRLGLACLRIVSICLLVVTLAEPVLQITSTSSQSPTVFFLVDGTDSMAIGDRLPAAKQEALQQAVGMSANEAGSADTVPTRMNYVQSWLQQSDNAMARLEKEHACQIESYLFDGVSTSRLRKLSDALEDPESLSTDGQVTALGAMLSDAANQSGTVNLAGVVVVSDFANNSGVSPLGRAGVIGGSPVERLNAPVYCIGVGATAAADVAVDLQTEAKVRRGERTVLVVKLQQTGLAGQQATVRVMARPLSGNADEAEMLVGDQVVTLSGASQLLEFPFIPKEAGEFEFSATVDPMDDEIVTENNRAMRLSNIIDDYVRLMYVAYEPTWEWRFVKEVFHRDKTVGTKGFRTYIASSDPRVREANPLFLPTLTPPRSDFFANDVIFLDDMPANGISPRFGEMVKEFVGELGGGLVIISGPRFGPQQLHGTPLAEMLPVVIDRDARLRDSRPFRLRRTPSADRFPFMRLADGDVENDKAWSNLGELPWYQPVAAVHEQAEVLAEHPTDRCGETDIRQPLIAVRRYGAGEVIYLGFNETWRLRRRYGEKYYRQFWSPLIDRLGMSHALGNRKRFVPRVDQRRYRVDDTVTLTVQAYDQNYEPIHGENGDVTTLSAELSVPMSGGGSEKRPLQVPMLRPGVFEARFPAYAVGQYTLRVKDPVTQEYVERQFDVVSVSAERRNAVRNERLQNDIASESGGKAYTLTTVSQMVDDMQLEPIVRRETRNHALWSTPLWFLLVAGCLLSEWLVRKLIRLR